MSLWEYKVITSGKGGFARPDLMEKFLNDLGRDEWEIVQFHTQPDNFLVFTGLARRSTQRDWTLEDAAAAAAKVEAEKLRAEFEAKFKSAASNAPAGAAEERAPSFLEEKAAPDDGFRKPVDTSHDDDPEAQEEDKNADDWDKLTAAEEDELPTFFEAIKPHMRRNQRGPGMSVGVDYLAKKWDQAEDDLKGALEECGFVMPADEDSKAEYVEYDGDLYWLNINRRGELWINTKEKPRPLFRPVKAQKVAMEEEASKTQESGDRGQEPGERRQRHEDRNQRNEDRSQRTESSEQSDVRVPKSEVAPEPAATGGAPAPASSSLPPGAGLLNKIRPHMRRNRRGPGGSGSTTFLSRALRTKEEDLKAAFVALGLTLPATPGDKPIFTEIGGEMWWLNLDSRGGLWINGREKKDGETAASANAASVADTGGAEGAALAGEPTTAPSAPGGEAPAPAPASTPPSSSEPAAAPVATATTNEAPAAAPALERSDAPASPLTAVRLLLKETKTGSVAAKIERLAEELGKSPDDLVATLVGAGLKVPEKPREKPVFVEHAGEILWFNKNAKGELWVNAKASKFADKAEGDEGDAGEGGEKPRRGGRSRKKETE